MVLGATAMNVGVSLSALVPTRTGPVPSSGWVPVPTAVPMAPPGRGLEGHAEGLSALKRGVLHGLHREGLANE
jgi:hypothetical protein